MNGLLSHLDIGRGLLALVISIALFSVVQRDQNPPETGSFDVPVDLVNAPPGLLVLGEDPARSVQVRVSAPRDTWLSLRPSAVHAFVDLSKATPGGDHSYPVSVEPPDSRIRVLQVVPPQLSVRLDENIERSVPVRLTRAGNVPFGYEAGDAEVEPTMVAVGGPASIVRRLEGASVEIKLDGLTVQVDGRYRPIPVDAQGQPVVLEGPGLRLSPPAVRVRIPITQQLSYKTVGVQPNVVGAVQSGYVVQGISTEPSAVTIVGSPQALAAVNVAQTASIDLTDASSTFARQVSVVVPEGVSLIQEGLARVTVRLAPIDLTQSLTAVPVPEDVTAGLQVVSALPSVQIVLQGAPSAARALDPSDLRVGLSLAGLEAGSHQVEVQATAPVGMSVQSINPRVISVTLAPTARETPSLSSPEGTAPASAEPPR